MAIHQTHEIHLFMLIEMAPVPAVVPNVGKWSLPCTLLGTDHKCISGGHGATGFSPALNDRALNKTTGRSALSFYSAPCRFSSAPCRFFSALSFSESALVSLGFHQRYFELEVAESVQLRRKVARFLCITLLFASDIAAILDLRWILIYAN